MSLRSIGSNGNNPTSEGLLPPPTNETPLLTVVWLKRGGQELDAGKIV
jgi:hypothetical protein